MSNAKNKIFVKTPRPLKKWVNRFRPHDNTNLEGFDDQFTVMDQHSIFEKIDIDTMIISPNLKGNAPSIPKSVNFNIDGTITLKY